MTKKKRKCRQFTSEEKATAVRRHTLGDEPISAVCKDASITPNVLYRWQKELFDHAAA